MTQEEFVTKMNAAVPGGKVAYFVFEKPQELPFVVYALPDSDDTHADDRRYFSVQNGWLELYMAEMDFEMMKAVETVFETSGLPWEKENEDYDSDEKVFFARWQFQLI